MVALLLVFVNVALLNRVVPMLPNLVDPSGLKRVGESEKYHVLEGGLLTSKAQYVLCFHPDIYLDIQNRYDDLSRRNSQSQNIVYR
jgi:hypothetical protein